MRAKKWICVVLAMCAVQACDGVETNQNGSGISTSPGQAEAAKAGTCKTALLDDEADSRDEDEEFDDSFYLTQGDSLATLADPVTYDNQIVKLLGQSCVNCHKPGGDRPDLSTYTLAKQNGPASLSDINRNRMPTRTPLVQADKDLFKAWADAGYPQNVSSLPPPAPPPAPAPAPTAQPSTPEVPPVDLPMGPPPPIAQPAKDDSPANPVSKKPSTANCK